MKFRYTILYVEDVAATLSFFENAFGVRRALLHETGDYGELDTGETKLSFSSLRLMKEIGKSVGDAKNQAACFEIAFETDDVSKALQRALDAGATLVQDIEDMPWGQTTSYVTDINGFLVEICTPVRSSP